MKEANKLYTFEDKTSDEILLINGFQNINQLIIYTNHLQSQLKAKEEEIEKQFKSMSAIIHHNSDLYLEESNKLIKERQQLKEVIKEAREYVKEFKFATVGFYLHAPALDNILSKGENK